MSDYQIGAKLGTLSSGAQRNHGTVLHALPLSVSHFGYGKALCGTEPGRRSIGWATDYEGMPVTCKRCLAKIKVSEQ